MNIIAKEVVTTNHTISHHDSLFTCKEHYLQFRKAWKQYIADGNHIGEKFTLRIENSIREFKRPSKLTCEHHLIYNAFRNRDLKKSFSPLIRPNKLLATKYTGLCMNVEPYYAFYRAVSNIGRFIKWKRYDYLLAPFNGTVTIEMLEELYIKLSNEKLC